MAYQSLVFWYAINLAKVNKNTCVLACCQVAYIASIWLKTYVVKTHPCHWDKSILRDWWTTAFWG